MGGGTRRPLIRVVHQLADGGVRAAELAMVLAWTRDQALEFLRSRRPGVRPNPAFMELLLEWERSLKE